MVLFIIFLAIGIPEEPKTAANVVMPTAPTYTTPIAPTSMGPGNFPQLVPSLIFIIGFIRSLCLFVVNSYFFLGPTPVEVAPPSRFEVGSSSTTVLDPTSEATSFFIRFVLPHLLHAN